MEGSWIAHAVVAAEVWKSQVQHCRLKQRRAGSCSPWQLQRDLLISKKV